MKFSYYLEVASGDYHCITNESPVNFKGVLFVGHGPPLGSGLGLEGIAEQVYPITPKLLAVPASKVPDEWRYALGYEKPAPVMDEEGEVLDLMPVPAAKPGSSAEPVESAETDNFWYYVGMLVALALCCAYFR